MKLMCRILGHSYLVIESKNWGKYYFGDGSGSKFLGSHATKLWCQRCGKRIDDMERII